MKYDDYFEKMRLHIKILEQTFGIIIDASDRDPIYLEFTCKGTADHFKKKYLTVYYKKCAADKIKIGLNHLWKFSAFYAIAACNLYLYNRSNKNRLADPL